MKALHLIFLIVLMASAITAQDLAVPSDPQDLVILQKSWSREFHYPGRSSNPFQVNEDHDALVRAQKEALKRNDDRINQNQSVVQNQSAAEVETPAAPVPQRKFATYVYQAKVKNTGSKTIRAISWAYVFIDPDTKEQMGHHKTTSRVRIHPGKSGELVASFASRPTHIVNINRIGEKSRDQFTERVIIDRIDYTDGSVWQRPVSDLRSEPTLKQTN